MHLFIYTNVAQLYTTIHKYTFMKESSIQNPHNFRRKRE